MTIFDLVGAWGPRGLSFSFEIDEPFSAADGSDSGDRDTSLIEGVTGFEGALGEELKGHSDSPGPRSHCSSHLALGRSRGGDGFSDPPMVSTTGDCGGRKFACF